MSLSLHVLVCVQKGGSIMKDDDHLDILPVFFRSGKGLKLPQIFFGPLFLGPGPPSPLVREVVPPRSGWVHPGPTLPPPPTAYKEASVQGTWKKNARVWPVSATGAVSQATRSAMRGRRRCPRHSGPMTLWPSSIWTVFPLTIMERCWLGVIGTDFRSEFCGISSCGNIWQNKQARCWECFKLEFYPCSLWGGNILSPVLASVLTSFSFNSWVFFSFSFLVYHTYSEQNFIYARKKCL